MKINQVAAFTVLTLTLVAPVQAQTAPGPSDSDRTQQLVDQLKDVIRGAEQQRGSNQPMVRQLRDLVRRYDWPWRVSLLYDDFRDGDYTYNPRWVVDNGEFWVARGGGLRSNFDPSVYRARRTADRRSDSSGLDVLADILLGSRERDGGAAPAGLKSESEIFTRVGMTNAFAVKLQLNLRSGAEQNSRFEFGPFQGDDRSSGYRLAYNAGGNPALSLLRFGPNRSGIIETADQGIALDDGNPHTIEWRRGNDSEMVVLLDDKTVIRTVDHAYDDPFDGLSVVNKGGAFEIKQVSIFGTQR